MLEITLQFLILRGKFTLWEATDDIRGNGDIWNMLQKIITNSSKLLNSIFTIHFLQNCVVTCLYRDMDEAVNSRMV